MMKDEMKARSVLCIAIVLFAIVALIPSTMAQSTILSVIFQDNQTSELVGPPPDIGENFTVILKIENISNLWSWKVKVTWDPTVLEVAHDGNDWMVREGDFLKKMGGTLFLVAPPRNDKGEIPELSCTMLVPKAATGSGTLAKITFHVRGFSGLEGTYINLLDVEALGPPPSKPRIPIDIITPGHFTLPPPPPTPPKAGFKPSTYAMFRLSSAGQVTVNFDASLSMVGWDTLPINHSCPITEYRWDFTGDGVFDLLGNSTVALTPEWNYTSTGDIAVTLEILAPDAIPPTHPSYANTSRDTHSIHILPPILGAYIDIYTNRGGLGQGFNPISGEPFPAPIAWSDAFGPQEEVTVYALITYNEEPLEYKQVVFEVKDSTDEMRVVRTAFTNASGIANMTFRIPWMGLSAESLYGNWTITGRVDVGGGVAIDVCQFVFGYLVMIQGITPLNSPVPIGGTLSVAVNLRTLSFTSKRAYATIILYDELEVPVGMAEDYVTVEPGEGTTKNFEIKIQNWAFVGIGTIFVNVFNQPSDLNGVPYGPEALAIFEIKGS